MTWEQTELRAVNRENARLAAHIELLERALQELAIREQAYRNMHDMFGDGSREAGRAWDLMRRAGNAARAALEPQEKQE